MHRSLASVGIAILVVGLALVAFPVIVLNREQLDVEQISGFLIAPVGLFVVMLAASSGDPRRTTVGGAFGNPDEPSGVDGPPVARSARPRLYNPNDAVHCRFCRCVITAELANCPRCSRSRLCRRCGRPLGQVLERPTCPTCAHAEAFCACAELARSPIDGARRGHQGVEG